MKVPKRKKISNSDNITNLKKRQNYFAREKEEEKNEDEKNEENEDIYEYEDYKPPSLENQLIHLQIEKQKLENEYIKLPEFSRNMASKLRRAEVENELDNLTKTISSVKSKLRSLNLI